MREAVAKRIEVLDQGFLTACSAYASVLAASPGNADLLGLIQDIQQEVLRAVTTRMPAPMRVRARDGWVLRGRCDVVASACVHATRCRCWTACWEWQTRRAGGRSWSNAPSPTSKPQRRPGRSAQTRPLPPRALTLTRLSCHAPPRRSWPSPTNSSRTWRSERRVRVGFWKSASHGAAVQVQQRAVAHSRPRSP